MADVKERAYRESATGRFVVDKAYLKDQARQAVKTFVAPLSGVYGAAKGDHGSKHAYPGKK